MEDERRCEQCGTMTGQMVNDEYCCPDCEKELLAQGGGFEPNPFMGREDERRCHCNNCGTKFREGEINCKDDKEFCPVCNTEGCIADERESAT